MSVLPLLHGFAVAFSPRRSNEQLFVTYLQGRSKNNILVHKALDLPIANLQELRQSAKRLIDLVSDTALMVRDSTSVSDRRKTFIPVSIGWEDGADLVELTKQLGIMHMEAGGQEYLSFDDCKVPLIWHIANMIQMNCVENLGIDPRLHFAGAGFYSSGETAYQRGLGDIDSEQFKVVDQIMRDDLLRAERGDKIALERLRDTVKMLAKAIAKQILQERDPTNTRFIKVGHNTAPFNQSPQYTFPKYFNFRDIAARVLREELKLNHTVYVKGADEPRGRYFEDILRTYLWDIWESLERPSTTAPSPSAVTSPA